VSIAGALKGLADLALICGHDSEHDAFVHAAARFEADAAASSGHPDDAPLSTLGLDPAILTALGDRASVSAAAALRRTIAGLPHDLQRLLEVPGLSTRELANLVACSGVTTIGELARWLESPQAAAAGLAPPAGIRRAITDHVGCLRSPSERIALGRAFEVADTLRSELTTSGVFEQVEPVGSLRRCESTVGDITLLASSSEASAAIARVGGASAVEGVLLGRRDRVTVRCRDHEVTIRVVPPAMFGRALLEHTGSMAHLLALRALAERTGRARAVASWPLETDLPALCEEEIYDALGLPFIAPEMREGAGEVEAALEGRLPRLLTGEEIRGDLHVHTTWSDGRDSIETMARHARALGYEYLAITDHSPATVARGLDADALLRQAEDIARVQDVVPGLTILRGVEVDILPDGRLDLPDTVLAGLDIVLASLHDPAGHSPRRLTERYLDAMRHPLVHIVTHPANRVVGVHGGYAIDFDRLFAAARDTGTALEIDGAPFHLDMDGALARRAIGAGVSVSVDSDCHSSERLKRQMAFGVSTARRGWVEARHVVNTRPLGELRAWLRHKRS
jgi:DNA polymerase (family 10)